MVGTKMDMKNQIQIQKIIIKYILAYKFIKYKFICPFLTIIFLILRARREYYLELSDKAFHPSE